MAISAISPISNPPVFIQPLALARQVDFQTPFDAALTNTVNSPTGAPAAVQTTDTSAQLINSLEQALFNQWLSSLQSVSAGPLGGALDSLFAGGLGITGATGKGLPGLPFDTSSPQSLLFTARLISLFNTMDLLGGDAGQASSAGSLLDTLA